MAVDARTIAFYEANAGAYAGYAAAAGGRAWLDRFAARLADAMPRGRVLDYGCGSGWAAAALSDAGFEVDALDASAALAAQARTAHGIDVRIAPFEALEACAVYRGVWAAFSLLHAGRDEIPGHIGRIARALVPGGLVYLGMKEGTGEARDRFGRRYTYVSEDELTRWLGAHGLVAVEIAREAGLGYDGAPTGFLHILAWRAEGSPLADG